MSQVGRHHISEVGIMPSRLRDNQRLSGAFSEPRNVIRYYKYLLSWISPSHGEVYEDRV